MRLVDDGPSGAVEGGVQEPSCLSRPETQQGFNTATPPPSEEPNWLSWGQEEASKLHKSRKRRRKRRGRDLIIAALLIIY